MFVRQTAVGCAVVLLDLRVQVTVNTRQDAFKAFGGVLHESCLESIFISVSGGHSIADSVWRDRFHVTVLHLCEDHLECAEDAVSSFIPSGGARVFTNQSKFSSKHVNMPQNLNGAVEEAVVLSCRILQSSAGSQVRVRKLADQWQRQRHARRIGGRLLVIVVVRLRGDTTKASSATAGQR